MNEHNKTVLVDMDGVMADFDTGALVNIPEAERVTKTSFYLTESYSAEQAAIIKATYSEPGFFEWLDVMPGLMEGWQSIIDSGRNPRVASAPLSSNPTSIEGKVKWLDRVMVPEFGPRVVEEAIINKKKWEYSALAILDDRPNMPRGADQTNTADWEHILFGWPHLSEVPMANTAFRLLSWHNTDVLLKNLEAIEAARY